MKINPLNRPDPVFLAARDATPLPLPAAAPAGGQASPAAFAALLRQNQAGPAAQPPMQPPARCAESSASADAPRPAANGNDNDNANDNAAPEADAAKAHAPTRPKLRGADKAATPGHPPSRPESAKSGPQGDVAKTNTATATDAAATAAANAAPPTETAPPTLDPALAAWLAALQAVPVPSGGEGRAPTDDAEPAGTDTGRATGSPANATTDLHAALSDKTERAAHGKGRAGLPATETPAGAGRSEASDARPALAAPVPAERSDSLPGLHAAAFNPAPPALREAPPPAAVALPTPVDAPEFAKMLGLQVSVLAQDGVQRAELHLNPAEMGPVSVQIVMDGNSAQVDFGSDVAATRNAIEAGLPELASALRDAGFTLTGGGVSQHSRGRGQASADGPDRAARATRRVSADALTDLSDAARATPRRNVRLGGLDLYA